jgi:ribosomal 50S subunit-associated protein YjgA (DUF615 family)
MPFQQTEQYRSAQAAMYAECGSGHQVRAMNRSHEPENVAAIRAQRQRRTHALLQQISSKLRDLIPARLEIKVTLAGAACRAIKAAKGTDFKNRQGRDTDEYLGLGIAFRRNRQN